MQKTIGIILVALGLLMMIYTGFNYVTTKRVADIGPIHVDKEEDHPVQWSPIIGGALLLGGIVVLVTSTNRK